jgi:hypothetical protein
VKLVVPRFEFLIMTALVLLFLVAPGESDAAVTLAMRQAAIQVLGSATAIVIRETPAGLSDAAAIGQRDALHAVVVVRLAWISRTHPRAELRLNLAGTTTWVSRDIGFEAKDAPAERGRALGYSVAAVVAGVTPPRATSIEVVQTGSVAVSAAAPGPTADSPSIREAMTTSAAVAPGTDGQTSTARYFFLDAAGAVSTGFGGNAYGRGGHARIGWSPTRRLRVMLGAGARVGTIDVAHASATNLDITAGAAFDLFSFWRVTVACRGDALLLLQSLSHFSDDDITPVHHARWLPGFRPQVEVSIWPSRIAAIIVGGGWEVTAGHTDVYVRGAKVAVIPSSRMIGELGLRVRF